MPASSASTRSPPGKRPRRIRLVDAGEDRGERLGRLAVAQRARTRAGGGRSGDPDDPRPRGGRCRSRASARALPSRSRRSPANRRRSARAGNRSMIEPYTRAAVDVACFASSAVAEADQREHVAGVLVVPGARLLRARRRRRCARARASISASWPVSAIGLSAGGHTPPSGSFDSSLAPSPSAGPPPRRDALAARRARRLVVVVGLARRVARDVTRARVRRCVAVHRRRRRRRRCRGLGRRRRRRGRAARREVHPGRGVVGQLAVDRLPLLLEGLGRGLALRLLELAVVVAALVALLFGDRELLLRRLRLVRRALLPRRLRRRVVRRDRDRRHLAVRLLDAVRADDQDVGERGAIDAVARVVGCRSRARASRSGSTPRAPRPTSSRCPPCSCFASSPCAPSSFASSSSISAPATARSTQRRRRPARRRSAARRRRPTTSTRLRLGAREPRVHHRAMPGARRRQSCADTPTSRPGPRSATSTRTGSPSATAIAAGPSASRSSTAPACGSRARTSASPRASSRMPPASTTSMRSTLDRASPPLRELGAARARGHHAVGHDDARAASARLAAEIAASACPRSDAPAAPRSTSALSCASP